MNKPFHTKYRPQLFEDVVGHDSILKALFTAFEKDTIPSAILLSGIHGIGKTTLARLIAKRLNCEKIHDLAFDENSDEVEITMFDSCNECNNCQSANKGNHLDILEMDAASHSGIDNMRDLLRGTILFAQLGKYRVYIIDEAHGLSRSAFNAMLKTLEEPNKGVKFILCTTEPSKLPKTIISRCMHFILSNASNGEIRKNLDRIIEAESLEIKDNILDKIVEYAKGSIRNSIQLLEQISFIKDATLDDLVRFAGKTEEKAVHNLVKAIVQKKSKEARGITKTLIFNNQNVQLIMEIMVDYFLKLFMKDKSPVFMRQADAVVKVLGLLHTFEDKGLVLKYLVTGLLITNKTITPVPPSLPAPKHSTLKQEF